MLRRGLATLGGRVLAAACSETSASLASSSAGSSFAASAAAAIRGAAVASSSSSSSSFWRGTFDALLRSRRRRLDCVSVLRHACLEGEGEVVLSVESAAKGSFFFCLLCSFFRHRLFSLSIVDALPLYPPLSHSFHFTRFHSISIPHIRLRFRHLPAARAHHPFGDGRRRRRDAPDDARAQEPDGRHYVRSLF